jgi:hypothetical protein
MSSKYHYIDPLELRDAAFQLAEKIYVDSSFQANMMISLFRGGVPIGMYAQEYLKRKNINVDHVSVLTKSYHGIHKQTQTDVDSVDYIVKNANEDTSVVIIDDIFDSGKSILALLDKLQGEMGVHFPHKIKIAAVFWKPENNKTSLIPDHYCIELPGKTWVVFPHEVGDFPNDKELEVAMGSRTLWAVTGAEDSNIMCADNWDIILNAAMEAKKSYDDKCGIFLKDALTIGFVLGFVILSVPGAILGIGAGIMVSILKFTPRQRKVFHIIPHMIPETGLEYTEKLCQRHKRLPDYLTLIEIMSLDWNDHIETIL